MAYLYNPRRATTEQLDRTFVARTGLLKQLMEHVRTQVHAKSMQHLLLVGPRGSGKTHLTTLLVRRILEGDLKLLWRPIQMAEEQWEVSTLRELLLAVFEIMANEAKAGNPLDDLTAIPAHLRPEEAIQALKKTPDPRQGAELGIALLNELARQTGRKNLLILENLDEILDEQFDDDFGLKQFRSELMTGSNLMLIATSPGRVTGLEDHDYPLFGLMRPISLEDFSLQELEDLLGKRAELESEANPDGPASNFLNRLRDEPHRIRALLFLTGGNPRMALMLYQVLVHGDIEKAGKELDELLDGLTTYFQGRLKELPRQEKKIVIALAKTGRALRPSEIAADVGFRPQQVSALIGRLVDKGHLRLAPQREGKGRYYVLREVLFRYWRQWRAQQREFSLFVDLLAAWYRRPELEQWLAERDGKGRKDEWIPLLEEALAEQPRIIDRLSLNQHQISVQSQVSISVDELSLDPMIRRLIEKFELPKDSPGEKLLQADQEGDWEISDALFAEVSQALRESSVPEDQEIGTLVRVIAHGGGDEALAAAEVVYQDRLTDIEVRYLRACALARGYCHSEAAEDFLYLTEAFSADEDPEGEACSWYWLASSRHFLQELENAEISLKKAQQQFVQLGHRLGEANTLLALGELKRRVDDLKGARETYESALPIYREIKEGLGEANTLMALGDLKLRMDDLEGAREAYESALTINRDINARLGEANTLKALGDLKFRVNDLEGAREAYKSALPIYREIRERLGEANTLQALGELKLQLDDLEGAREAHETALHIYRDINSRLGEANTLLALGLLKLRVDDLKGARESYKSALHIYRDINSRLGEANTLRGLGKLKRRMDELEGAREAYESALPIYSDIEERGGEANTLTALGELKFRMHDLEGAREAYESALTIDRDINFRLGEANTLSAMGDLKLWVDDLEGAREAHETALHIYRDINSRLGEANTLLALGLLKLRVDDLKGARESYKSALHIYRDINSRLGEANTLLALGGLGVRVDDLEGARAAYETALTIYREIKERLGESNTLRSLGLLFNQKEKPQEALESLQESIKISESSSDTDGLMRSHAYRGDALMGLQKPAHATLAYQASLQWAGKAQNVHGQTLTLWKQASALNSAQQGKAALAALFLCRPLAMNVHLPYEDSIQKTFENFRQQDEESYRSLMAEFETDAEAVRLRGVQAASAQVSLEKLIDAHQEEMNGATKVMNLMIAKEASDGDVADAQKTMVKVFEEEKLADIVPGMLQHALLQLLRAKRHESALEWIDRLDQWLPNDKKGLFQPFAIAARHLRGQTDDKRILDQQAPEIRQLVEMILEEVEKGESDGDNKKSD